MFPYIAWKLPSITTKIPHSSQPHFYIEYSQLVNLVNPTPSLSMRGNVEIEVFDEAVQNLNEVWGPSRVKSFELFSVNIILHLDILQFPR